MEEHLGNEILLDRHLVAFFASREYSEEVAQRAMQWAEEICQTDKVVISGFHSPLEKEVLRVLLEHKHPVVVALGRALYKRVPPNLQQAFDEGDCYLCRFAATRATALSPRRLEIGKPQVWQTRCTLLHSIGLVC